MKDFSDTLSRIDHNLELLKTCFRTHPELFSRVDHCSLVEEAPIVFVWWVTAEDREALVNAARKVGGTWTRHREAVAWNWRGNVDGVDFQWKCMEHFESSPAEGSNVFRAPLPREVV